ncbi:MAG: hypothetical protein U5P41_02135 [Gammaproteobacteria bacterium]|nr:hypothetical protein [Gammaproteobacteria bacterium]
MMIYRRRSVPLRREVLLIALLADHQLPVAAGGAGFSALSMQPEETADAPEPISDINVDDITTSLRIERPDAATIELRKDASGDWRLTQPMQADAEDDRIASILLLPQSGSESRFPATDQKLDRFGLSPAPLTLTL